MQHSNNTHASDPLCGPGQVTSVSRSQVSITLDLSLCISDVSSPRILCTISAIEVDLFLKVTLTNQNKYP